MVDTSALSLNGNLQTAIHNNGDNLAEALYDPISGATTEDDEPALSLNSAGRKGSVTLEKTGKRGRYILTADDPEIRGILKRALAREQEDASGKRKSVVRDILFTRRFTAFDRQNVSNTDSPFFGFFVLFWIVMAFMLIRVAAKNWKDYGSILGSNEIMKLMFGRDIIVLAVTDGVMCASTALGLVYQKMILKGDLDWDKSGWIIQQAWQTFYLFAVLWWAWFRDWPWTHTIFIVLHALVFLMKQHSYNAYNGYLSVVFKRKTMLERKLAHLDTMKPNGSLQGHTSVLKPAANDPAVRHRRLRSLPRQESYVSVPMKTDLADDTAELASIASAIESDESLDPGQFILFNRIIRRELSLLEVELRGKCSLTENHYPNNLNLKDFVEWTFFPTLVYELEYPREEKINWAYVAEKTGAVFGVLAVMQIISQAYIYPVVASTIGSSALPPSQRLSLFLWASLDLLFPLLLEQLLTWYLIWECVLNVLAELTGFADRGFYGKESLFNPNSSSILTFPPGAWWNSVDFGEYARDWNRPVHNFLLRHVYNTSIASHKLSKWQASLATFALSACIHELVMACLFRRVRGYLAVAQLMQVPLVAVGRVKFMRERKVLGNVVFWVVSSPRTLPTLAQILGLC